MSPDEVFIDETQNIADLLERYADENLESRTGMSRELRVQVEKLRELAAEVEDDHSVDA